MSKLEMRYEGHGFTVHVEPAGENTDRLRVVRETAGSRATSSFSTDGEAALTFARWVNDIEDGRAP